MVAIAVSIVTIVTPMIAFRAVIESLGEDGVVVRPLATAVVLPSPVVSAVLCNVDDGITVIDTVCVTVMVDELSLLFRCISDFCLATRPVVSGIVAVASSRGL